MGLRGPSPEGIEVPCVRMGRFFETEAIFEDHLPPPFFAGVHIPVKGCALG